MKRFAIALLALSSFAAPASSAGYFMSGNDAFPLCSSDKVADINVCTGMVMGFVDAGIYYDHELWKLVCLPEGIPSSQVRDVYAKHLRDNPARRHLVAVSLFLDALIEAFPC